MNRSFFLMSYILLGLISSGIRAQESSEEEVAKARNSALLEMFQRLREEDKSYFQHPDGDKVMMKDVKTEQIVREVKEGSLHIFLSQDSKNRYYAQIVLVREFGQYEERTQMIPLTAEDLDPSGLNALTATYEEPIQRDPKILGDKIVQGIIAARAEATAETGKLVGLKKSEAFEKYIEKISEVLGEETRAFLQPSELSWKESKGFATIEIIKDGKSYTLFKSPAWIKRAGVKVIEPEETKKESDPVDLLQQLVPSTPVTGGTNTIKAPKPASPAGSKAGDPKNFNADDFFDGPKK